MLSKEEIIKLFETEMWLFIDGSLSEDRIKFWEEKISEYPELKEMLIETNQVLEIYDKHSEVEIDSKYYKEVIEKTISQKTLGEKVKLLFGIRSDKSANENGTLKIAFGSTLVIASIIIFMVSKTPNPVKNISAELLEWNPEEITEQIRDAQITFNFIKDEEAKKYVLEKISNDEWSSDVYQIGSKIKQMNREIEENKF